MNELPHVIPCVTYCNPNKRLLADWLWKNFSATFCIDHSVRGDNFEYIGFWTKAGTNYYASIISPNWHD